MVYLKIYDEKTRMYPSGKVATKDVVYADYPAAKVFTHVIGTDRSDQVIRSIQNLNMLKEQYDIADDVSDEEAVAAIQEIMNTPAEPVEEPVTADERIAAALEYQNLLTM